MTVSAVEGGRLGIGVGAARWLAAAAGAWVGAALGLGGGWLLGVAAGVGVWGAARRLAGGWVRWLTAALVLASLTGGLRRAGEEARARHPVPNGAAQVIGRVLTDPVALRGRETVVVRPEVVDGAAFTGADLAVEWGEGRWWMEAGQWVRVEGRVREGRRRVRGRSVGATLQATDLAVAEPEEPWLLVGNGLRAVVRRRLPPDAGAEAGLLRGFLIGDTEGMTAFDLEALRRAGLTHFVAVSGSNVALFLGIWFVVLAPVVRSARARAVAGVAALAVFVVMTRWEPSVVRAAAMAALVLAARAVGVALDGWSVLGAAVGLLLVFAPELAGSVGFQLSVAATVGVMVGVRAGGDIPGRLRSTVARVLRPTVGAQLAVVPILLVHFGRVPLLAPVANLVAAPLVSVATVLGVVGVAVGGLTLTVAVWVAGLVVRIAHLAGGWPQLDLVGVVAIGVALLLVRRRWGRWMVVVGVGTAVCMGVVAPRGARPAVVFLDVGQGDAALVMGTEATLLVDGGPDPVRLARKLAAYGIDRLDLVIVSHPHADHVAGLAGLSGRIPVGAVWYGSAPHTTDTWERVSAEFGADGVPIVDPGLGVFEVGDVRLEVVGPRRRYASPNDQSLVVRVLLGDLSVLFAGDVEAVAQQELGRVPAAVLKVPHQGAATSDEEWLTDQSPSLAVIPVGPNSYGHPAPWVVESLTASGAKVVRTDQVGDVVVTEDDMSARIRSIASVSSG